MSSKDRLPDKQAQVMPFVCRGYSSKEIALELGISPATVDQRIDGARRKLGAATRKEAARLFESRNISERTIYPPLLLTDSDQSPSAPLQPQDDLRVPDEALDQSTSWTRGGWRLLPDLKPRDLGKASRLLVILLLAVLLMVAFGEAVELFSSLRGVVPS